MPLVGIIANPASGKDIRRLVAYGSVFDNQEKVRIVRRVLLGLSAVGVDQICYMPDYYGIVDRALAHVKIPASVFPADFEAKGEAVDSIRAARVMEEQGASCIVTLGGDGTNRAVAKGTSSVPILPISTGTNNVFPFMIEGTIAGLAAGVVARRLVALEKSTFRSTKLEVVLDHEVVDQVLVDVLVCDDLFVASRAVWEIGKVRQIFLNRCDPGSIGFSSIGGLIRTISPEEPVGMCLALGNHGRTVTAPVAPGVIERVRVAAQKIMGLGEEVEIGFAPSTLALDGEREVEVGATQRAAIRLSEDGPAVVDIGRTMAAAAKEDIFASNYLAG